MHHHVALPPLSQAPPRKAVAFGHVMRSRIATGIVVLALSAYAITGCIAATHGRMPQVTLQTLSGLASTLAAGFINTDDGPA